MEIPEVIKELEYELVHNTHFNEKDKEAVRAAIGYLGDLKKIPSSVMCYG